MDILLYTLMVLPIVIWIMQEQFSTIPIELEEAAFIDGLSVWGVFLRIVTPLSFPGMVAAFILCFVLSWNEYFRRLIHTRVTKRPMFAKVIFVYFFRIPKRHWR
jgi:ABC-type glycerol-3-phosphate transport system permease component